FVLEDPATVAALPGSRVEVRGRGASRGAADSLGASVAPASGGRQPRDLAVRVDGDAWSAAVVMPPEPAILRLRDRAHDRLVVLEPVPDEPPILSLLSPIRDSTFAEPKGKLDIDVQIQDDLGLARAEIELLYTSGGGGRFGTKGMFVGRASFDGSGAGRLRPAFVLDTMGRRPGDVRHIRAVAWDRNDVTGPGQGESETRTIRIRDPRDLSDVRITAA